MSGQFITLQSEKLAEARRNYKSSHDQLIKTKKKLLDVRYEIKSHAAAIEELHKNPDCTAYSQAGRAFIGYPGNDLAFKLEEDINKASDVQTQLIELEKRMADRVENNKILMNQAQDQALKEYQDSLASATTA